MLSPYGHAVCTETEQYSRLDIFQFVGQLFYCNAIEAAQTLTVS